ncbi:MAG: divalent-cation tolerance protein CutA [Planctomycetota bacterium]
MTSSPAVVLESGIVEIGTTFESRPAAVACAERLVAGRLAACVQVDGPLASTYRWRSAVETAEEWRCTCKTTRGRRDACIEAIIATHPYETPQVTVAPVDATAAYAAWVRASVEGPWPA